MTNKIRLSHKCIEIHCDATDTETIQALNSLYPLHRNRSRTKPIYYASVRKLPEVLKLLRGVDETNINLVPANVQELFYKELSARREVADLILNGPRQSPVVNEHLTLARHQQLGREIAQYHEKYAFFYDTRTGKTPLSLAIMRDDIIANPTHKWLVVCPLILIDNAWLADAAQFIPDISVVGCHASTKAKRLKLLSKEANIYVTNTESFASYHEYFREMGFTGCFVDESSCMKSASTKISRALVEFAQSLDRFYILSGSPAPNGEYEYYMQMCAIDLYSMPQSYSQFEQYYFVNIGRNPQYKDLVPRPDRHDELLSIIKQRALYVDKEDALTTPGRTFHEVEFDMPAELKKHYNKLKNELYTEVKEGLNIIAPSAAAKLNKLNQVTSGFIIDTNAVKENKFYDSRVPEWYLLDSFRFKKLLELLESDRVRGEQVLIWANYRTEFELIKEALGDRCRCVYGGATIAEKNEAIRLFKEGKIQYLIANPASADKGLTLTNAHISVYFSLNWSYELFKQSMERIYGDIKKQPKHCHYYVMIAKGSIDRVLYSDVLQGKGSASMAVLNHLKGGAI